MTEGRLVPSPALDTLSPAALDGASREEEPSLGPALHLLLEEGGRRAGLPKPRVFPVRAHSQLVGKAAVYSKENLLDRGRGGTPFLTPWTSSVHAITKARPAIVLGLSHPISPNMLSILSLAGAIVPPPSLPRHLCLVSSLDRYHHPN